MLIYKLFRQSLWPRVLNFSTNTSWNRDSSYYEEPSQKEQEERDRSRLAALLAEKKQLEEQPPRPANRKRPNKQLRKINWAIAALRQKLGL